MNDFSPIQLTNSAIQRLNELLKQEKNAGSKLRIYITGGGCSGFQYGFKFDKNQNQDDFLLEKEGVFVVVDPMSLQYLIGAAIDFVDGLEGSRFVVNNPNATITCGCGSSFSI